MITSCSSKKLRNRSKRRFGCLGENTIRNNCVAYNPRSELTGATLGITPYVYNYDNIANRETAQEATDAVTAYEPIATRPFSIRKNGTWYTYAHDLTKNVTELYKTDGTLEATYDYTPYGAVTKQGIDDQPFQWSSEVYDTELDLTCYNFRYYNTRDGRWISRDIMPKEKSNIRFIDNNPIKSTDYLGLIITPDQGQRWTQQCIDDWKAIDNQNHTTSPDDAQKACDGYDSVPHNMCTNKDCVEQKDDYPIKAKKICHGFVSMYTKNGKTRDAVACVANCLVSSEIDNQKEKCCDKRNAARLIAHFDCYAKCGFLPDFFTKDGRGLPEGGYDLGIQSLLPAFCREILNNILPF